MTDERFDRHHDDRERRRHERGERRDYRVSPTRGRRALIAILAALALGSAAVIATIVGTSEGGEQPASPVDRSVDPAAQAKVPKRQRRKVTTLKIGRGAKAVVVLRPSPAPANPPAIIFLHGWGLTSVSDYGPWLRHLARRGNVVIFPRYQVNEDSDPGRARRDAVTGIRAALRRVPIDRSSLVVGGHSAGAAIAGDYAAFSRAAKLPQARGIFAVYPGRAILGYPRGIPAADYASIPATTQIAALAGARDSVVGQRPARKLIREAVAVPPDRRRFVLVSKASVADHYAPTRSNSAARRAFWVRFDRLIARSRGG